MCNMAALRRHVFPLSRLLQKPSISVSVHRHLFSGEILGIDSFRRQRLVVSDRLGDVKDTFLTRMKADSSREDALVFTEDIKTLLHTVESDEELTLLVNMLKRHLTSGSDGEISRFQFGPPLLRLMYVTKRDDMALSLFRDQTLGRLFSHVTSHLLLMDLLYESHRYQEVEEIYTNLRKSLGADFRYPTDCTTLFLAALYKMNTQEALTKTVDLLKEIKNAYMRVTARALSFAAYLALNQNKPATALEICSNISNINAVSIQNLKMISYAQLGRVEDTLPFFRQVLQDDRPILSHKIKLFPQTVSAVKEAVDKTSSVILKEEIQSVSQALQSGGLLREDSLKDFIEKPIHRSNQVRDSFKSRQRSPIDGARSRGPGFKPGYKRFQHSQGY